MKTVLLGDAIEKVRYKDKVPRNKFLANGKYPVVSQEQALINGYWDNKAAVMSFDRPVVIFGDHTKAIKFVDFDFVLGADGVKILNPIREIDPRYFYYALQNIKLDDLGYARHFRLLKESEITYPELEEQKWIVKKLDEAFTVIDKAKQNTEKNFNNAQELLENVLNSSFDMGSGKSEATLKELTEPTQNVNWKTTSANFKYIDLTSVDRETSQITASMTVDGANAPSRAKKIVRNGDVIFGTTRPTLKRIALIDQKYDEQICSTGFCVLRAKSEMINNKLIYYFLKTRRFMESMERLQRGTSYPAVTDKDVKDQRIVFPDSVDEQTKLVAQLDKSFEQTQKLQELYCKKLAALEELRQSILKQAFEGEL